jgi:hypothetical protein
MGSQFHEELQRHNLPPYMVVCLVLRLFLCTCPYLVEASFLILLYHSYYMWVFWTGVWYKFIRLNLCVHALKVWKAKPGLP